MRTIPPCWWPCRRRPRGPGRVGRHGVWALAASPALLAAAGLFPPPAGVQKPAIPVGPSGTRGGGHKRKEASFRAAESYQDSLGEDSLGEGLSVPEGSAQTVSERDRRERCRECWVFAAHASCGRPTCPLDRPQETPPWCRNRVAVRRYRERKRAEVQDMQARHPPLLLPPGCWCLTVC